MDLGGVLLAFLGMYGDSTVLNPKTKLKVWVCGDGGDGGDGGRAGAGAGGLGGGGGGAKGGGGQFIEASFESHFKLFKVFFKSTV